VSISGKTPPAITERKESPQAAVQKPEKIQRMFLARPHPDLLPSVFATLRRDRAGAESEGGQEKEA